MCFTQAQANDAKAPPDQVNLNLLCDALEYLATEYWDELNGYIRESERDNLCAQNYGRPFKVTSLTGTAIKINSAEYKIKYNIGFKGKPVESPLNLHLKVRNDPCNLLRIYFLYDKIRHLIVVGSLPKHLPI